MVTACRYCGPMDHSATKSPMDSPIKRLATLTVLIKQKLGLHSASELSALDAAFDAARPAVEETDQNRSPSFTRIFEVITAMSSLRCLKAGEDVKRTLRSDLSYPQADAKPDIANGFAAEAPFPVFAGFRAWRFVRAGSAARVRARGRNGFPSVAECVAMKSPRIFAKRRSRWIASVDNR